MRATFQSILVIIVVVIVVVACQGPQPTATPDSTVALRPSATWHDNVVTFVDPLFGLALDLPYDWHIIPRPEPLSDTSFLFSVFFSPCMNRTPDVLPPCSKVQLSLNDSRRYTSAEFKTLALSDDPSSRVVEQRELNLDGLPAIWIRREPTGTPTSGNTAMIQVLILVDERIVLLNVYGELSPGADIVDSVRYIRSAAANSP